MHTLFVVGIGPGGAQSMTEQARSAMEKADVLCGYTVYIDLVAPLFPGKGTYTTPMKQEIERCRWALETAQKGQRCGLYLQWGCRRVRDGGPAITISTEIPRSRHPGGGRGDGCPVGGRRAGGSVGARFLCDLPVRSAHPVGGHRKTAALCSMGRLLRVSV